MKMQTFDCWFISWNLTTQGSALGNEKNISTTALSK
jgi:hypothetical protein